MKYLPVIALITSGLLLLSGCTSHKRMPQGGPGAGGSYLNGQSGGGAETYTEGTGRAEAGGYCESSKCRPGRQVPRAEQHYFFDFDSSDVRSDSIPSIQLQANYLLKHPEVKIRLEGNTDDVGSREYNIALGERRARAVLEVLRQNGVAASQVSVISFGAEKPAAGGEDEKSRQCNRRVDLLYSAE